MRLQAIDANHFIQHLFYMETESVYHLLNIVRLCLCIYRNQFTFKATVFNQGKNLEQ